ncbi:MAG: hypothetical protein HHAS10_09050 [Candidatus Altimarinota bacterium]
MLENGLYPKDWKNISITEEEMEEEYRQICNYLEGIGWNHYEISNWAKPGFECTHNQGYWKHENSIGFGLSASSYHDGRRWENESSFQAYYKGGISYDDTLSPEQIRLEKVIHDFRTFSLKNDGFNKEKLNSLQAGGLIRISEDKILPTEAGIFRENFILSELI